MEPVALNDVIDLPLSCLFERKQFYPFMYRIATVETEFVRYNYQYYPAMDWVALLAIAAFAAIVLASKLTLLYFLYVVAQTVLAAGALLCDAAVAYLFKRTSQNPAGVHELIFWFGLFCSGAMLGVARPSVEDFCQRENMSMMRTTASERHDVCLHSIYAYPLAIVAMTTVCGRPRVHFVISCAIAYLVAGFVTRSLTLNDTTEESALKLVADAVILIASIVCKAVLERAHRLSFEEFVNAYRSRQHAARQKEATDAYLSQLLPPHAVLACAVSRALRRQRHVCQRVHRGGSRAG